MCTCFVGFKGKLNGFHQFGGDPLKKDTPALWIETPSTKSTGWALRSSRRKPECSICCWSEQSEPHPSQSSTIEPWSKQHSSSSNHQLSQYFWTDTAARNLSPKRRIRAKELQMSRNETRNAWKTKGAAETPLFSPSGTFECRLHLCTLKHMSGGRMSYSLDTRKTHGVLHFGFQQVVRPNASSWSKAQTPSVTPAASPDRGRSSN